MHTRAGVVVLTLAAVAIIFAGCGGGGDAPGLPGGGTDGNVDTFGNVRVMLTDAPATDLAEVWVNILRVELVPGDDSPVISLDSDELPAAIELLGLADEPMELGVIEAPAGAYEQVRLVLAADGHYLVDADGNEHELFVPSGAQTGVKVNFPDGIYEVVEGDSILLLDFLAGPSVHQTGQSGMWIMRPVIHGSAPVVDEGPLFGSIEGTVAYEDGAIPQPKDGNPPVVFVEGEEAESFAEIDPETGAFEIPSLLAGEYELKIGWLDDEGEIVDGDTLIVTEDGVLEEIGVTVEADTTLQLDLTVQVETEEGADGGASPDGDEGDAIDDGDGAN